MPDDITPRRTQGGIMTELGRWLDAPVTFSTRSRFIGLLILSAVLMELTRAAAQ